MSAANDSVLDRSCCDRDAICTAAHSFAWACVRVDPDAAPRIALASRRHRSAVSPAAHYALKNRSTWSGISPQLRWRVDVENVLNLVHSSLVR